MTRPYVSAELTGADVTGAHGFILWGDDGALVATFRMHTANENLEPWMREMVVGHLVDQINAETE